jgi:hypothetical protein
LFLLPRGIRRCQTIDSTAEGGFLLELSRD